MTKCFFCKKHIWLWQSEFWGYHTRCYSNYLNGLPYEKGLFMDDDTYRRQLLTDLREMRDKCPELKLRVPLQ